ncbi:GNAT family N-acetyltransferase [Dysgonomonas capnocytophagoides]|uniref:GNAT family N-acetyltransferase n=1 Tax=Dysgonomonas capnocytophagoides TaxID=45254 RepID=UPI0029210B38|nr:GNAT family N-acetyltransferase [Dysgonomonas capnocytophagoides]
MTFKTLHKVDLACLTKVFNAAFKDYRIPMQLTENQLSLKLSTELYDANLSVGAFEGDKFVGFILHGFREHKGTRRVYNMGTGVVPDYRGKALTKRMYEFIVPSLKKAQIDTIQLEVLENNLPAIATYLKIGFKESHLLNCYKGITTTTTNNVVVDIITSIETLPDALVVSDFAWQNEVALINDSNIYLGTFINGKCVGCLVLNPSVKRIHYLYVHEDFRRKGIAKSLLNHVVQRYGDDISAININAKNKDLCSFFEALGLVNFTRQYEMKYYFY